VLRQAAAGDAGTVVGFIRALAEYERLAHEMVANEGHIRTVLSEEPPVVRVVLAELDGSPVGFALFFFNFSTFLGRKGIYVEDLFVLPEHRARGVGTALLAWLGRLALERDCGRVEWSVLDWNEPSIRFYRSLGAETMDEWTVHRVTGPAIRALAGRADFGPVSGSRG